MDEKLCPLCGKAPAIGNSPEKEIWCSNRECKLFEIPIKREFWQIRPIENDLESRLNIVRDELHTVKSLLETIEAENIVLKEKKNELLKTIQTSSVLISEIQNKKDALQKNFDEYKESEEKKASELQNKNHYEKQAYQYDINTMKNQLEVLKKALLDVISVNTRLDTFKVEQNNIVNKAFEEIKELSKEH